MLVIGFPWVVLLMDDNPLGALGVILLQATLIGWIPASMWAHRITRTLPFFNTRKKKKKTSASTAIEEK